MNSGLLGPVASPDPGGSGFSRPSSQRSQYTPRSARKTHGKSDANPVNVFPPSDRKTARVPFVAAMTTLTEGQVTA